MSDGRGGFIWYELITDDVDKARDFYRAVLDWKPDVICVYATTGQETWPYAHIERWRRELPHLKTVSGGPHPSFDTDLLTDAWGVSLYLSTAAFATALALIFGVWHRLEHTLSITDIVTRRREAFYWVAILCTFALGTAAGVR